MSRFVVKIEKDFNWEKPVTNGKNYPIDITVNEEKYNFIELKTSETNIYDVYEQFKSKLSNSNSLLFDEFYSVNLGDTLTGNEIIFIVEYGGNVILSADDIEPISSAFGTFMEENYPEVLKKIQDDWNQKIRINKEKELEKQRLQKQRIENQRLQKQRIKRQKIAAGIVDENDEDTWPTWKVYYIGESGQKHIGKVKAINKSHAYDVAYDIFWDIADAGDDKLRDIISITKL